ncbi:DUF3127 domain-containing protein [Haloferula sp.]|uniref:DUF3127 domain-containing protein n=1 Tax=Haloferula sp. TaxID=2497595 RepID=UPI0032A0626E
MANNFELTGTLKHLMDLQTFSSGFTKREFVIEVQDGKYPQMVKFECVKDKTAILDGLSIGDNISVTFDIRGNEYKERFYVNLVAWKLSKADGGSDSGSQEGPAASSSLDDQFDNEPDDSDDIPF